MKLRMSTVEVLAALHHVAPATVKQLETYLQRDAKGALEVLRRAGLVVRNKWEPPALTGAERAAYDPALRAKGKRPYVYAVAPAASPIAYHLARALELLSQQENEA